MLVYVDSSFLISLYRQDANHSAAQAYVESHKVELSYLQLHRVEVRNALRVSVFQNFITEEELKSIFRRIEDDLSEGFLVHVSVTWNNIFRRADELSETYVAKSPQRALDILHVAAAWECGASTFATFDHRQRSLAKISGLTVKP